MRRQKPRRTRRPNPLTVSEGFRAFVLDQLEEVGDVTARSMFGGVGVYQKDVFFGIIAGDALYLKVDATNQANYEAAGMRPFKPYRNRPASRHYYQVPVDVLESAFELASWARKAVAAAERKGKSRVERASPPVRLTS